MVRFAWACPAVDLATGLLSPLTHELVLLNRFDYAWRHAIQIALLTTHLTDIHVASLAAQRRLPLQERSKIFYLMLRQNLTYIYRLLFLILLLLLTIHLDHLLKVLYRMTYLSMLFRIPPIQFLVLQSINCLSWLHFQF